jgi:hypothetical protein
MPEGETTMFKIELETDNDAFQDNKRNEVAAILQAIVETLQDGSPTSGGCYDTNGNRVGRWSLED